MLAYLKAVRKVATRIAGAVNHSVEALREKRVEQEPAMTDRMLGAIEESVRDFRTNGIRWSAKTLTDRGPGAQEFEYGADFMGVLSIELPQFSTSKGFLAQAKLLKFGRIDDPTRLRRQCKDMLKFSPASFVFLYSERDVRVVPALAIVGTHLDPLELYHKSARSFFEGHLECFIGDKEINSPTPETLDRMRQRYQTRSAILLQGEDETQTSGSTPLFDPVFTRKHK